MGRIYPIDFPIARGKLSLYITDFLIGFALAFFCMDITSRNSKLQSTATHQVPAVRLGMVYLAMSRLLQHPFKVSREEALKSFLIAFQEIKDFWNILKLPARTFDNDFSHILKQCAELMTELHSLDAELRVPMDLRLRKLGTK
jgi:hypothetical protein